jgi:hypothetical protein
MSGVMSFQLRPVLRDALGTAWRLGRKHNEGARLCDPAPAERLGETT